MKVQITIEDKKDEKIERLPIIEREATPPCRWNEKWPENYYYDQVNDDWRLKSYNPGGRCQSCGSIYSCLCR